MTTAASQVQAEQTRAEVESLPDVPDAFEIRDAASANWLVRKIIESRAYAEHVKEWAALEVRRAEREERFFLDRFGHQLERWAREQMKNTRRKSIKLPAGAIGFRTALQHLEVADEPKLIVWCRRHLPSALRVQTHVLKSLVKEHVEKTGECPDGAEIASGGERFYIS
jgi:hypothetical protein